jgi:hypothetical protein
VSSDDMKVTAEGRRLAARDDRGVPWDLWGPYVSCRAWGTVREDYSDDGEAWDYFPHDHARSRAYRWNEDGLAGLCDRHQHLCFGLALWNGHDAILKERPFGLTGGEGNHGEDVKDYWFYLDNTPTHSSMRMLYKYPQAAFPYQDLVDTNRGRTKLDPEYELVDTGIFDDHRYFDVAVEYAKADVDDIVVRITATNRGPDRAPLHVLPTLWFRNTWSWGRDAYRPMLRHEPGDPAVPRVLASHALLGEYELTCLGADELLFTENETNSRRLFGTAPSGPYVKDAFHRYVVDGESAAVNPAQLGTKAAAIYRLSIGPGEEAAVEVRLRRIDRDGILATPPTAADVLAARRAEADQYYAAVLPASLSTDARLVARQAFAGMLWSKQYYHYIVRDWLEGDPTGPPVSPARRGIRNANWRHLHNADVISMPDTWEFPWYASWDLAFHCTTLALLDPGFAKQQILLMMREWYMDPDGRVPAYEWNFDDVNPPVLPLATAQIFNHERALDGVGDTAFLERAFHKLLLNFTWWVNREDADGNDVFEGGFLGLDNIGPFDRSKGVPPGYLLGQADGTAWMAVFAQTMQLAALALAAHNPVYEDLAVKFFEHSLDIAHALNAGGHNGSGLWDDVDGFYYDVLETPDGRREPVRAHTIVGFVPLFGSFTVSATALGAFPTYEMRRAWYVAHRPDLAAAVFPLDSLSEDGRVLRSVVPQDRFERMAVRLLDEDEFLSPFGIRAVSRYHHDHPLVIAVDGVESRLDYEPGESTTNLFGGNSNWRGPIWMPINFLLVKALDAWHQYFGADLTVTLPTGSGTTMDLGEAAAEIARRNASIFLRGADGRRPVFGDVALFQDDPHWRDLIPFHEYFHGDTGRGCGASHQTGWTGLVGLMLVEYADRLATPPAHRNAAWPP